MLNIEVGKTYNVFDDGKIRESRRHEVTITEIVPYAEIDLQTLIEWRDECRLCPWLYKMGTDYFVFGTQKLSPKDTERVVFVRSKDDRWFSMGWWAGVLDVDGNLTKSIEARKVTNGF